MKKLFKRLLACLVATVSMVCVFGALVGCAGDPKDDPNVYAIYVKYEDGTGVAGVEAQWCTDRLCNPADGATDANGKLTFPDLAEGTYHILLKNLPAGYTYEQNEAGYYTGADATPDSRIVTITLRAE